MATAYIYHHHEKKLTTSCCIHRTRVNTAVVITLIFPFTSTINGKLIPQIEALFMAEIVTTTVIQLLDPAGHFERHFLAPRAPTQDAMNLKMQGSLVELAERYTNMTKM
jgi:hypothetical protein